MRNTWARAWIAACVLLLAASVIARGRHDTLLEVEEPVMDWILDGTNTSGWERASALASSWLVIPGTILLALVAFFLDRRVALMIVVSSAFATILANVVGNVVDRTPPSEELAGSSFPSLDLVQAGVFWGLIVLTIWWIGAPRLVWQIALELAIVVVLLVAIGQIVSGQIWPSDAVGSMLVVAISLIMAAVVFESFAPRLSWMKRSEQVDSGALV